MTKEKRAPKSRARIGRNAPETLTSGFMTLTAFDLKFEEQDLPDPARLPAYYDEGRGGVQFDPARLPRYLKAVRERPEFNDDWEKTPVGRSLLKALSQMHDIDDLVAHQRLNSKTVCKGLSQYLWLVQQQIKYDLRSARARSINRRVFSKSVFLVVGGAQRGSLTLTRIEVKVSSGRLLQILAGLALAASIVNDLTDFAERIEKNPQLITKMQKRVADSIDLTIARLAQSGGPSPQPNHNPVEPNAIYSALVGGKKEKAAGYDDGEV